MCMMYSKVVIAVFFRQTIVHESLLKERLDFETLENVSILPSKAQFLQKYVKTKTRL